MKIVAVAVASVLLILCGRDRTFAQPASAPPHVGAHADIHIAIDAAAIAGLMRRSVTVTENGADVIYTGVDLGAVLAKNGAPQGATLRGAAVAQYALVRAADGYRAVFALAELDPAVTDKIVLLADSRNGVPLAAGIGPYRVVVPDEKHHLRWIHSVDEVDVLTAP